MWPDTPLIRTLRQEYTTPPSYTLRQKYSRTIDKFRLEESCLIYQPKYIRRKGKLLVFILVKPGKNADQKHLDFFPNKFPHDSTYANRHSNLRVAHPLLSQYPLLSFELTPPRATTVQIIYPLNVLLAYTYVFEKFSVSYVQ